MASLDASGVANLARRLNLITDEQFRECSEELNLKTDPPEAVIRFLERRGYVTSWQGQRLIKGEKDGYFLGGYRLLYRIAAGSFGRVFRADDPRTGEIVAIKVLRRRWTEDPHKVELFEREGKVGLSLVHPNIVRILAVSRDPATGQYFIVMEFVEGGTLRDLLRIRQKLKPAEALKILEESAAGLALAFSRGLTHRDIKPTNILISSQGVAKLVDFGLAEITGGESGDDKEKEDGVEVDRTVDYAGLERATGATTGDPRSDIYFLGCVFYEMLTGRPLLEMPRDKLARMSKQRFEAAQRIDRQDPDLPGPVVPLLEKMVAFDPNLRFQSAAQLVEAVRTVRAEVTGETTGPQQAAGPRTIFVIEHAPRLQDAFRQKFKELGFRVLISIDEARAVERYQKQPFHALLIDAGTTGEKGIEVFERILSEADVMGMLCVGILILSEDQSPWAAKVRPRKNATILVRPVTMKQLTSKLREFFPQEAHKPE